MSSNLAQRYANAMTEHPYGHALFRPASSTALRPGSCGYLNEQGKWNPVIANIEDTAELQRAGAKFSAPRALIPMDPESHFWGPKAAMDMTYKCTTFSGAADATSAGFPAEIGIALEFSTRKDFGAILHCAHQVEEHGFYHRDAFVQWAKANAQSLIDVCPDVKRHGVWIVISTFETREVDILAWTGRAKVASMGFKVAVPAAGEIGPSGKFVKAGSAGEWNHDAKDEKDGRLVVFFTGVFLKYRWQVFGSARLQEQRGEEVVSVKDPEDSDDLLEVECSVVGVEKLL